MTIAPYLTYQDILARGNTGVTASLPTPFRTIQYGKALDQIGQLWLPDFASTEVVTKANTSKKYPVVILIHGGCWRSVYPGPELVVYLAEALASRGIAVWSISYRRINDASTLHLGDKLTNNFPPYPNIFLDVACAADMLHQLADHYPLDLSRVVTTGHSAGGHLAMWLAARKKLPRTSALYAANPLAIYATIGIAALPDLAYARDTTVAACGEDTVNLLIDYETRGEAGFSDTSVAALLPLGVKQILISAAEDEVATPAHAERYARAALLKNETVELLTLDNTGHFELIAPWTPAGQCVVDTIVAAFN